MKNESLEELFTRIEASKRNKKAFINSFISTLGLFDTDFPFYHKLKPLIIMAYRWAEKHGIKDFYLERDFEKLPYLLRMKILDIYLSGINYRLSTYDSNKKLFYDIDLMVPRMKVIKSDIKEITLYGFVNMLMELNTTLVITITGWLGSGKTDFALNIAQHMLDQGYIDYIITNIGVFETHPDWKLYEGRYIEVSKLSDIILTLYEYKDAAKVLVIDEAAIHLTKRLAMSKTNITMNALRMLFRKLHTHVIYTSQTFEKLDKDIRDDTIFEIRKFMGYADKALVRFLKGKLISTLIFELEDDEEKLNEFAKRLEKLPNKFYLTNIYGTEIPFNSEDVADLEPDLDLNTFHRVLSLIAENAPVEQLRNLLHKTSGTDGQITELKRELYEIILKLGAFTYQDVMDILNINYKTLTDYVNKLTDRNILRKIRQGRNVFFELTNEGRRKLELILETGSENVVLSQKVEEVV